MTFEEICAQMREKLDALAEGNYHAGLELIGLTDDLLNDPLCKQYVGNKELAGDDIANMLTIILAHACKDYDEIKQSNLQKHLRNMFIAIYAEPPIYTDAQLAALLPRIKNPSVLSHSQFCLGNLIGAYAEVIGIDKTIPLPNTFSEEAIKGSTNLFEKDRDKYYARLNDMQANVNFNELVPEVQQELSNSAVVPLLIKYFHDVYDKSTKFSDLKETDTCLNLLENNTKPVTERMSELTKRIQQNPQPYMVMAKADSTHATAKEFVACTATLAQLKQPLGKLASYYSAHGESGRKDRVKFHLSLINDPRYTPQQRLDFIQQDLPKLAEGTEWQGKRIIDRIKSIITNTLELLSPKKFQAAQEQKAAAIKEAEVAIEKTPRMTR